MKQYELTVLIHPDLEMNLQPATDKIQKVIASAGGEIIKENDEGKKHLSYEIEGQLYAVYYYYELNLPSNNAASKISGALNLTDEVIRYLLVKADPHRPHRVLEEDAEADEAKEAAEPEAKEAAEEATKETKEAEKADEADAPEKEDA